MIVTRTVAELEAERVAIFAAHPELMGFRRKCCMGCTEGDLAMIYGWGDTVDAYCRLEDIRFLLGEDRP